jgi:hypothetical protein
MAVIGLILIIWATVYIFEVDLNKSSPKYVRRDGYGGQVNYRRRTNRMIRRMFR